MKLERNGKIIHILVEISYLPNVVAVAAVAAAAVLPGLVLEVLPRRLRLHRVVAAPAVRLVRRARRHAEGGRRTVLVLRRVNCKFQRLHMLLSYSVTYVGPALPPVLLEVVRAAVSPVMVHLPPGK